MMLNNTPKAEINILFFTRCAKVGSESMIVLLSMLSEKHHFHLDRVGPAKIPKRTMTMPEQREVAKYILDLGPNSVYIEHINYINFTSHKMPQPISINMVRDPVERMISWYFYARNSYHNAMKFQRFPEKPVQTPEWFKKDFNECVRSGDLECQYIPYTVKDFMGNFKRQSLFFCGHFEDCLPFNSPVAVQIAKHHVETQYAVVGTWEETNITLAVFEAYIPYFFKDATEVFYNNKKRITEQNKNKRKPFIEEDVKALIRKNFTHEFEFYHFCRQRLFTQFIAINKKKFVASKELASLNANELNNTRHARVNVIFFNRAAKVGSESLMELVQHMAETQKHLHVLTVGPVKSNSRVRTLREQLTQAKWVARLEPGSVYIEHCNWLNFTQFKLPKPIYINLVRDPVERVISWYFYIRNSYRNAIFYKMHEDAEVKPPEWFKKDFNECVRSGDVECQYVPYTMKDLEGNHKRQTLFFCGHSDDCLPFDSPYAIQLAKANVERDYAVVGSWEDTNVTLTVFEHYIPYFFRGVKNIFESNRKKLTNRNRNNRKPKIDDDVKMLIRKNFTNEYDFYYFCKQRLYRQYLALGFKANLP